MNRLTGVSRVLGGYYAKQSFIGYSYEEEIDKLGELEDIEEELGIDLITLFKALRNDVYFKVDNIILHCQVSNITSNSIYIRPDYYTENRKYDSKYWQRDWTPSLKDYGKNWALTKEELENE